MSFILLSLAEPNDNKTDMAKNEQMLRLKFIEEILKRRGSAGASFEEIEAFLVTKFEEKDIIDKLKFTKRTFQRDKIALQEIFGIFVSYSKAREVYYIEGDELDLAEKNIYDHLLLVEAYRQTKDRSEIMMFQSRKPKGLEHLHRLVQAILNKQIVRFSYHKFWAENETQRVVEPYALKEVEHRWYLLASDFVVGKEGGEIKAFGLDRISNLEITNSTYKRVVEGLDKNYTHSFGIVSTKEEQPEKVVLAFDRFQGNYIKTLPLHHSQQIISETENEVVVELQLVPTYDFEHELLSFGSSLKIIQPESLKLKLKDEVQKMLKNFS